MGMPCGDQNSVSGNRHAAPDTMRFGGFDYEVRGNDRATKRVVRERSADIAHTITNPTTNQAGKLAPLTTVRGQALRRAGFTVFMRQMNPIERVKGFANNVGSNRTQGPNNVPVIASFGYQGILPLAQQPRINKPLPY